MSEDTTLPQTGNKKSPLLIVMGIILVLLVALLGYKFIIKK
ncbi:hypothetical protein C683_0083 [Catellicoccus marimammalium M35/04/3]|uniref:Gram-positive cocci surface proteins LPxTG domain-containing protein n=2 Tax=Catellicoccus TaxID=300418 RepID=K8ZQV3_9ENTE|nr:hypothetical protein C683_0083 [Catellicoccus marimammalium M35/04/3]